MQLTPAGHNATYAKLPPPPVINMWDVVSRDEICHMSLSWVFHLAQFI